MPAISALGCCIVGATCWGTTVADAGMVYTPANEPRGIVNGRSTELSNPGAAATT